MFKKLSLLGLFGSSAILYPNVFYKTQYPIPSLDSLSDIQRERVMRYYDKINEVLNVSEKIESDSYLVPETPHNLERDMACRMVMHSKIKEGRLVFGAMQPTVPSKYEGGGGGYILDSLSNLLKLDRTGLTEVRDRLYELKDKKPLLHVETYSSTPSINQDVRHFMKHSKILWSCPLEVLENSRYPDNKFSRATPIFLD